MASTDTDEISNALHETKLNSAAPAPAPAPSPPRSVPLPAYLPVTLSRSYEVHNIPTDCWVQIFQDRVVVGVSQLNQKVGNWCLCQALQSPTDPRAIDYTLSTLLGDSNNHLIGVYARQLTERLIASTTKGKASLQVLLGISLARNNNNNNNNNPKESSAKDQEELNRKVFRVLVPVLVDLVQDAASL
jgi:hypothetical protein